jgi:hypothetical protein
VPTDSGTYRLPDAPIAGIDDRHIRALNGLIGAMQQLGSARISALTAEVNRRLPRTFQVNEQYVRAWLTRHPELFTASDHDRFRLASMDVDILCGLASSWQPMIAGEAPSVIASSRRPTAIDRLHERVASDIAAFLRDHGPQPIARIRSHLYGRFVGQSSADAVIARDPQQRFIKLSDGLIGLRSPDPRPTDASPVTVIEVKGVTRSTVHQRA